jgi:hypothetical protein
MAIYVPAAEFEQFNGALIKKKNQKRLCVTRRKKVKDPLTGEVVGLGPKGIYSQERRDMGKNPLTPNETVQRSRWREACREAPLIYKDKTHPRFMEMYNLWRAQLTSDAPCKQFQNFVRGVLASEKREEG